MSKKILFLIVPLVVFFMPLSVHAMPVQQLPSNIQEFVVIEGGQQVEIPPDNIIDFETAQNAQIQSTLNSNGQQIQGNGAVDILQAVLIVGKAIDYIDTQVIGEEYTAFKYDVMHPDDPTLETLLGVGGCDYVIAVDYFFTNVLAAYDDSGTILAMYTSATQNLIEFSDALLGVDQGYYNEQGYIANVDAIGSSSALFIEPVGYWRLFNFRNVNNIPVYVMCPREDIFYFVTRDPSARFVADEYATNRNGQIVSTSLSRQQSIKTKWSEVDSNGNTFYVYSWVSSISSVSRLPEVSSITPLEVIEMGEANELKTAQYWNYENGLTPLNQNWYNTDDLQALQNDIQSAAAPNPLAANNTSPYVYPQNVPQPIDIPLGLPTPIGGTPQPPEQPEPPNIPIPDDLPTDSNISAISGLETRFPFCIPFELKKMFDHLKASPEAPYYELPLNVDLPFFKFEYTFVIDLKDFDSLALLFRRLQVIVFVVGLAVYSYGKFFGGGNS